MEKNFSKDITVEEGIAFINTCPIKAAIDAMLLSFGVGCFILTPYESLLTVMKAYAQAVKETQGEFERIAKRN